MTLPRLTQDQISAAAHSAWRFAVGYFGGLAVAAYLHGNAQDIHHLVSYMQDNWLPYAIGNVIAPSLAAYQARPRAS